MSRNMSTAICSQGTVDGNGGSESPRQQFGTNLIRQHLERLQKSPTETLLLDGGTGEELFLRGVPDDRKIWSATSIVHQKYHSIVEDVHKSFIRAGSQAITTNSYGITPGVGFADGAEVKRLTGIAGEIARRAAKASSPCPLVLGSLGPQLESYRPDLVMKHDDGVQAYRYPIEGLYPHIDAYLAETMSSLEEAWQAIDALSKFYEGLADKRATMKHPMLVSFTLDRDGQIRSGESVMATIPKLIEYAHKREVELVAVLFNCCEPESISKMLMELRKNPIVNQHLQHPLIATNPNEMHDEAPKIYLGAYANRLTPVDPQWTMESSDEAQPMRDDLSPQQYWGEFVRHWHNGVNNKSGVKVGAGDIGGLQLIGGCCGIGPGHVSVLRDRLQGK
ncbi:hypothetical protein ACHAWF_012616 [Thalassiosira exigua]